MLGTGCVYFSFIVQVQSNGNFSNCKWRYCFTVFTAAFLFLGIESLTPVWLSCDVRNQIFLWSHFFLHLHFQIWRSWVRSWLGQLGSLPLVFFFQDAAVARNLQRMGTDTHGDNMELVNWLHCNKNTVEMVLNLTKNKQTVCNNTWN